MKKILALALSIALCSAFAGFAQTGSETIVLATTTSTQQTGLLDQLLPAFTKATGITVKPIAVGTGKAIGLAKNGDADVVMVHARKLEDRFMAEGYGENAWDLMYNDFVITGPASDPAQLKGTTGIAAVMGRIASSPVKFVSRGDKSGTHEKELDLWNAAGAKKMGELYIEAGQGMSETLKMADELQAYTLCDRATWLSMRKKVSLIIAYENPVELKNPYGVIAVSQAKNPKAKTAAANRFIEWIVASEAASIISGFKIDNEELFHLDVKKR